MSGLSSTSALGKSMSSSGSPEDRLLLATQSIAISLIEISMHLRSNAVITGDNSPTPNKEAP